MNECNWDLLFSSFVRLALLLCYSTAFFAHTQTLTTWVRVKGGAKNSSVIREIRIFYFEMKNVYRCTTSKQLWQFTLLYFTFVNVIFLSIFIWLLNFIKVNMGYTLHSLAFQTIAIIWHHFRFTFTMKIYFA